ncbi:MAG: DUF2189 domain-containing protein [Hyphomicrobiales bacterium]|nr:DUF2189 domain-containing protein [Hyphomicrobiales bacterium]
MIEAQDATPRARAQSKRIAINAITTSDVFAALGEGWSDFKKAPFYGMFFGGIYALGGMLILSLFVFLGMPYVGYPLTMGFALIVPFVAAGTYEISRRIERGEPLSWNAIFAAVWNRSGKDLGWMALVTVFVLIIWVDFAIFLFLMFYGLHVPTVQELLTAVLTTQKGMLFAALGNAVGAAIALFVFSITAVSFPMLADRDVDFVTAMITSVRAVAANPGPMIFWAVLIGIGLGLSIVSLFFGLFVVLPIFGHATWHIYRKLIP